MADRDVRVRVTGDTSGFERAMGSAAGSVDRFGSGFGRVTRGVVGMAAGAFAVDQIVGFGSEMLNAGTQVQTWGIKVDTVFGDAAASVRTWADQNNEALGVTDDALAGMAAGLGDLLVPLGFTRERAAEMSTTSLDLAGALSAWSGGTRDVTQVSEILQAAMLGETDGLKGLGISISAADVATRVAADGKSELTGAALAQAEAEATLALIMEKSTDAQAAWANGSMDAVKNQNELTATTAELRESLAVALLPALQGFVDMLVTRVIPGVRDIAETWGPRFATVFGFIGDNIPAIVAGLAGFGVAIAVTLVPAFIAWATAAGAAAIATIAAAAPAIALGVALGALGVGLVYAWRNSETFRDVVLGVVDTVRAAVTAFTGSVTAAWRAWGDEILGVVRFAWEHIRSTIDNALTIIRGVVQTVTALIRGDWSAVWDGLRTIASGVWAQIRLVIGDALTIIRTVISTTLAVIASVFSAAWDGIRTTVVAVVDGIRDRVVAVLGALRDRMGEIITAAGALVAGAFRTMRDTVVAVVDGIRDRVVAIFGTIRDRAGEIINAATGLVAAAFQSMRETVVAVVDGIRDRVVDIFGAIRDRVGGIIGAATSNVAAAFQSMRETVRGIVDGLRDSIITIFESLRDRIGGIVGTVVDRVASGFGRFRDVIMGPINAVRGAVDGLISAIGRIPSSIPNPLGGIDVPFFADGGLVTRPTFSVIGEAGPELVLPLRRPARMAELLRSVGLDGAAGPSYSALPELGSSSSGAQVININVTALTAEAARSYAGLISDELRRLDRSAS
jgi:phage-related protein